MTEIINWVSQGTFWWTETGQSIIASWLVVNEDWGNLATDDFRVETGAVTDAFVIDASAGTAEFNVPLTLTGAFTIVGAVGITGGLTTDTLVVSGESRFNDKIFFTQTDWNEYIDSLNDGYMDYWATTWHRFNNTIDITTTTDPQLRLTHTDWTYETDLWTNSSWQLEIMPTARTIYLWDWTAWDSIFGFYGSATIYTLTHDESEGNLDLSANNATDFSRFESDWTLEFNGAATVWRDNNMGAAQLSRPASSQPDLVNFVDENGADTGIQTYWFAVWEKVHGSFEMQHDYKQGSDFTFHVHWQGITVPTGTDNVQWRLTYTLMRDDSTLDAVTTIDSPDDTISTQYMAIRSDFAAITGTDYLIGDQFLFTLERVAATWDAYAGDAVIATAGLHYEIDTVGSRQIIAK